MAPLHRLSYITLDDVQSVCKLSGPFPGPFPLPVYCALPIATFDLIERLNDFLTG